MIGMRKVEIHRPRRADLGGNIIAWIAWLLLLMIGARVIAVAQGEELPRYQEPKVVEYYEKARARTEPLWLTQGVRDSWQPDPVNPVCIMLPEICKRR